MINPTMVLYKLVIATNKTEETMEAFDGLWLWPIDYGVNLRGVSLDTFGINFVAEVVNLRLRK